MSAVFLAKVQCEHCGSTNNLCLYRVEAENIPFSTGLMARMTLCGECADRENEE